MRKSLLLDSKQSSSERQKSILAFIPVHIMADIAVNIREGNELLRMRTNDS